VRIHPFPNGNGRTARILVRGRALRPPRVHAGTPTASTLARPTRGWPTKQWKGSGRQPFRCFWGCTQRRLRL